ncbi:hypothetical protein C0Q70_16465 [Pomacea canaliculata]|uniref:TIR domain-containing protein n=1 Tax=Pomacea canaliculata TaxID=400727 RepID=A0A2T7NPX3_POMCA|nr:hypothetical protein C0Q70_16465 [Pomacea canaliculata]
MEAGEDGHEDRTAGKTAVEEVARRNGIVCNTSYPSLSSGPSLLSAASITRLRLKACRTCPPSSLQPSDATTAEPVELQPRVDAAQIFIGLRELRGRIRTSKTCGRAVWLPGHQQQRVAWSCVPVRGEGPGQQRVRLSWSEHSDANTHAEPCEKESSFCDCACEAHRKISQTKSLTIQLESPLRAVSTISNETPAGGGSSRVRYHHGRTLSDFTHKLRLDHFGDSPKASDLFRPSSPPGHRQQTAKNRRSYHGPETERLVLPNTTAGTSRRILLTMAAGIRIPEGQLEDSSDYPQAVCDSHLSAYSSDCPSDTQPLLAVPKVRVQSSPVSSDLQLCLDNSLARFPYRSEDSASCRKSSREESNGHNATTVLIPPAASSNSTGETPRLGVVVTASSPTGSDTLAAPPLSELYRYHVFFSHCAQDVAWVQSVVERLQDSPYNYRCAFSPDLEQDRAALEQNLLCSAMLSERVILVLSRQYVKETWYVFEKILRQLTQMSLHNQRIMGVLLEDCVIPESLGELYFLDTSDPDFFEVFTKRLKSGRIPRSSDSVSSDLAGRGSIAPPPSTPRPNHVVSLTQSPANLTGGVQTPLRAKHENRIWCSDF